MYCSFLVRISVTKRDPVVILLCTDSCTLAISFPYIMSHIYQLFYVIKIRLFIPSITTGRGGCYGLRSIQSWEMDGQTQTKESSISKSSLILDYIFRSRGAKNIATISC